MARARLQTILCPIDLSDSSARAMAYAVATARASGARLIAFHVTELDRDGTEPSPSYREAVCAWIRAQAVTQDGEVPTELIISPGRAAREILIAADGLSADLIVMGTHGASGFDRFVLGSVAEKVLRKAGCPVLTVPPATTSPMSRASRVLCAVDFSECSLAALEFLFGGGLASGADLTLFHVLEWPWYEPPAPLLDELPPAEAEALGAFRLKRETAALARLRQLEPEGFQKRCHVRIAHGRSYEQILRVVEDEKSDLIVLGVHGRSSADLALFGSTAHQLVRRAHCPVLTVRA